MKKENKLRVIQAIVCFVSVFVISQAAMAQFAEDWWVARYEGTGNGNDIGTAMVVDAVGNVYVTGGSEGINGTSDYATVKYNPDGNELWVARYDSGSVWDRATALVVDETGNVVVTGNIGATVKYDPNGNELWVAQYDGNVTAVALDGAGNVVVAAGVATVKYDADGNELWVADGSSIALAVDSAGNVVVAGSIFETTSDFDYVTTKYDVDGNALWVARFNGPENSLDRAEAMTLDPSDNVVVTGYSHVVGESSDYATVKYDPDGNQLWVARYDGPASGTDYGTAVATDAAGNVHVAGSSWGGTGSWNDYATIKYDYDGNELWVARYGATWDSCDDDAKDIVVDAFGNVYVTGVSHVLWTYENTHTVKYDRNGNELWLERFAEYPEQHHTDGHAIALDRHGNVVVLGQILVLNETQDYVTIKYEQSVPPSDQMANILLFFNTGLQNKTIKAKAPRWVRNTGVPTEISKMKRRRKRRMKKLLNKAEQLIATGFHTEACGELEAAFTRCDGQKIKPQDWFKGQDAPLLAAMIEQLMIELDCQ